MRDATCPRLRSAAGSERPAAALPRRISWGVHPRPSQSHTLRLGFATAALRGRQEATFNEGSDLIGWTTALTPGNGGNGSDVLPKGNGRGGGQVNETGEN